MRCVFLSSFLFRYSLSCREGEGESCTGDQAHARRTKDKRLGHRGRVQEEKQRDGSLEKQETKKKYRLIDGEIDTGEEIIII